MLSRLLAMAFCLTVALDFGFAAKVREVPAEVGLVGIDAESAMFNDGYKVSKVTLTYKKKLDPSSVTVDDYEVKGLQVESVEVKGTKVTININCSNVWYPERKGYKYELENDTFGKYAIVTQKGDVTVSGGKEIYTGPYTITSPKINEPRVFKEFWDKVYVDLKTDMEIRYAAFTPANYDKGWEYPVIVYIPDSRATTNVSRASLLQGVGGSVWASKEEQGKHQCIIIAVQYPKYTEKAYGPLIAEDGGWTPGLEAIYQLVRKEISTSRADRSRIYAVGQGEGAAANLLIGQKYPDFYAAQVAISPIFEIKDMEAIRLQKLWVMVSSKDSQSYEAMEKCLKPMIGEPNLMCKETWSVDNSAEEFEQAAKDQIAKNSPNNYTVIDGGCREYTWCIAHDIEAIRDWLTAQ
ncbi:MAG: hypothetical protein K6G00_11480 [Treponema sp.]|nr:hypothetical protein [Treponema sp.]